MPHYSDHLLKPVTIQRVSDGSRFYPGVPNTSTPFVYNGSVSQLQEMLNSGNYVIVGGANTLSVVDTSLIPQSGTDLELDGRVSQFLTQYYSGGSIPSTPTGVTATPGNNQVVVSWSASSGATGYNVKRSTISGSETTLAAGGNVSGTTFTDTTAVNGTLYYYVVSALNANGESVNSSEVSATPYASITIPTTVTDNFSGAAAALQLISSSGYPYTIKGGFSRKIGDGTIVFEERSNGITYVERNTPDVDISVGITSGSKGQIALRAVDDGNYISIFSTGTTIYVFEITEGQSNQVQQYTSGSAVTTLRAVAIGSTYNIYVNGSGTALNTSPISDTHYTTGTRHGYSVSQGYGGATFNSFSITNAAGGAAPTSNSTPQFVKSGFSQIRFNGDSITAGFPSLGAGFGYPRLTLKSLGVASNYSWFNAARTGAIMSNIQDQQTNDINPLYDNGYKQTIDVLMCGTNDLASGVTAAAAYSSLQSIVTDLRTNGHSNKIIFITTLPRGANFSNGVTASTFETARQAYITSIVNGGIFDQVVRVDQNSTIGQFGQDANTTYYADNLHPTTAGHQIIANLLKPALQAVNF